MGCDPQVETELELETTFRSDRSRAFCQAKNGDVVEIIALAGLETPHLSLAGDAIIVTAEEEADPTRRLWTVVCDATMDTVAFQSLHDEGKYIDYPASTHDSDVPAGVSGNRWIVETSGDLGDAWQVSTPSTPRRYWFAPNQWQGQPLKARRLPICGNLYFRFQGLG